jgi:hypothetical protein
MQSFSLGILFLPNILNSNYSPLPQKIVFSTRRVAGSIVGCTFSVCAKSVKTDFHTDFPHEEKSV